MHRLDHLARIPHAGDHQRYAVFGDQRQVGLQALHASLVDVQVHRQRTGSLDIDQVVLDLPQPAAKLFRVTGIVCRQGADHAAAAARTD
ncbi:hypothetical protein D3C85_1679970 [compost metagenome]